LGSDDYPDDYPVYDAAAFVSRRSNMSGAARAPPGRFQGEVAAPEERGRDIEDTAEGRVSGMRGAAPIGLPSPRLSESPGISGPIYSRYFLDDPQDEAAFVSRRAERPSSAVASPPGHYHDIASSEATIQEVEDIHIGGLPPQLDGIMHSDNGFSPPNIFMALNVSEAGSIQAEFIPRREEYSATKSLETAAASQPLKGLPGDELCAPIIAQGFTSASPSVDRANACGTSTSSASESPADQVPQKATISGKSRESKDDKATKGISENRTGKSGSRPSILSKFKNAMRSK
jgi:hypothetical protein